MNFNETCAEIKRRMAMGDIYWPPEMQVERAALDDPQFAMQLSSEMLKRIMSYAKDKP